LKYEYAPWRFEYVDQKIDGCIFCHIAKSNKNKKFGVLFRDKQCFVVMNKYPYTPAHFMVIPNKHIDNIQNLNQEIWLHISKRVQQGTRLLKDVLKVKGINIGMNLGSAAGAGISEHIHYHLVPRWERDTNFITTIGKSRVYSVDFDKIYAKLYKKSKDYFV
jgi:diadenosine tetraphosphate (Ap4A) HIT family hydrolase